MLFCGKPTTEEGLEVGTRGVKLFMVGVCGGGAVLAVEVIGGKPIGVVVTAAGLCTTVSKSPQPSSSSSSVFVEMAG